MILNFIILNATNAQNNLKKNAGASAHTVELTLEKIAQYKSLGGSIDLYWNIKKCLFLAKPKGFIHPRHIRFDLNQLRQKTNNIQTSWTYVVDTSEVIFANPLNIFYLYRIKSITGFNSS